MYECPNRLCKLHTWTKSPSICSDARDVPVVKPVTENICIVCSCACCCLSFTWKCSYAAGPLQSAGTITPEIKQWFTLKGCDVQILPVHLRARWKKKHENFFFKSARNAGGGASAVMGVVILIFCDTEQTYSHFFPLTRSSLSWTEVIIPRSCECLPGLC